MYYLQAGEALLERCVFVHLARGADKLALLLAMVSKLLALASGACGEDNPDALPHHEVPSLVRLWAWLPWSQAGCDWAARCLVVAACIRAQGCRSTVIQQGRMFSPCACCPAPTIL